MSAVSDGVTSLRRLLHRRSVEADRHWREWARNWVNAEELTPAALARFWQEVCRFDDVLAQHVEEPVELPDRTVIVAGSGKENFKTFNVSTPASILAAAAGAKVVKGVSRSVSAVSGATDIIDEIGLVILRRPEVLADYTETHGVAFVSYAAFCPTYAQRYDGVFEKLTPFSFFMPVSVLAVRASAFVFGLADSRVTLSGRTIQYTRPDIQEGVVISTEVAPGQIMDEEAPFGLGAAARVYFGNVEFSCRRSGPPPRRWEQAIAHRQTHKANAAAALSALAPGDGPHACSELVEINAATILRASRPAISRETAREMVREARRSGAAERLVASLRANSPLREYRDHRL